MGKQALLRVLGSLASPGGARAKLSILIYHRVLNDGDPMRPGEMDHKTFRWQMQLLARQFNVLPLSEALVRLRQQGLPARTVCVTFDDGYADNATVALPILQETGIPATFFVAVGFLNGGVMWNDIVIESLRCIAGGNLDLSSRGLGEYRLETSEDRVAAVRALLDKLKHLPPAERKAHVGYLATLSPVALPSDLMMSSWQVKMLHQSGMEIGAHTVSHPILARLDGKTARKEIVEGKERLEALIGHAVELFAYPNGKPLHDYLPEHVAMVRQAGFKGALTTAWGVSTARSDLWQLPRFTPWDATPDRFMARLLWNCRQTAPTTVSGT